MTTKPPEQGIKLYFKSSRELKSSTEDRRLEITLETTIPVANQQAWGLVQKRLQDGLTIYAVGDFRTQLNDALVQENATLERRLLLSDQMCRGLRAELDAARAAAQGGCLGYGD